jgi:diacylglycerol kinase (ATP)
MILLSIFRSVSYAWRGLRLAYASERNFRIQTAFAVAALVASVILPLEPWERVAVWMVCAGVLVLELANSMVERLSDLLKPRLDAHVKDVKDLMAGAVLVTAALAILVGVVVFAPHLSFALIRL